MKPARVGHTLGLGAGGSGSLSNSSLASYNSAASASYAPSAAHSSSLASFDSALRDDVSLHSFSTEVGGRQHGGGSFAPVRPVSRPSSGGALLRNTTPHDRRLMVKKAHMEALARTKHYGLVGVGGRRVHVWRSPVARKDKQRRMLLVQHPSVFPVLSRHLAARMIQRWWHRLHPSVRSRRSAAKVAAAAAQGLRWEHPYAHWQRLALQAAREPRRRRPAIASAYFLETGAYATQLGSAGPGSKQATLGYKDWCAGKIARAWLHAHTARRYRMYARRSVYGHAAVAIQRAYRELLRRRAGVAASVTSQITEDPLARYHEPACTIQRAYRRFTQRRIFQYFRELILARQNSNPYLLLKMLEPSSGGAAGSADHASGLYLRFRLGGAVFPPILYYKTFTHFSVTDIGSFAPRDYARDRKMDREKVHTTAEGSAGTHASQADPTDRARWYKRFENNGWRPLLNDSALVGRDVVYEATSAVTKPFHPNKLVRQLDALKRRKARKVSWMRKLYSSGVVALPTAEQLALAKTGEQKEETYEPMDSDEEEWAAWKSASAARLPGAGTGVQRSPEAMLATLAAVDVNDPRDLLSGEWEDEAADLLDWAGKLSLDYEQYNNAWLVTATSRPNEKEYRSHDDRAAVEAASAAPRRMPESGMASARSAFSTFPAADSYGDTGGDVADDDAFDENEGLPAWIGQTASRAHLASQASLAQLRADEEALSNRASQSRLSPPTPAPVFFGRRASPLASSYKLDDTQHVAALQVKVTPSRRVH